MIGRRRGAVRPRRASALLTLLVVVLTPLTACDRFDTVARDLCIAALPGLEEGGGPILVVAATTEGGPRRVVRIQWRSGEGRAAHDHETTCAFTEDEKTSGGAALAGIRTERGELPPARLFVLRRFWLADAARRAEGLARVSLAPGVR